MKTIILRLLILKLVILLNLSCEKQTIESSTSPIIDREWNLTQIIIEKSSETYNVPSEIVGFKIEFKKMEKLN